MAEITRVDLERRMDVLMQKLSTPPTSSEFKEGWTESSKKAMKNMVGDVQNRLRSGQPNIDISFSRGMDSWGIVEGEILEEAAELSNALREFSHGMS
jgi:hypothetical protein